MKIHFSILYSQFLKRMNDTAKLIYITCLYIHLARGNNHNQIRSVAHPQPYLHK